MFRIAWIVVFLVMGLVGAPAHAETDWSFWVTNETSYSAPRTNSLLNPNQLFFRLNKTSEDFMANGRFSLKIADNRIRFQSAAAQKLSHAGNTNVNFLLREAFAVFTLNENLDVSAGKKLVKWGTGVGYNPSGFADPPKDAQDPSDRLGLNQGTELVQINYVRHNHSIDVLYFAPRLYFARDPILSRDHLALRYNHQWKGLDISIMGLIASGGPNKIGANYSYVLGRSFELHGELALLQSSSPQVKEPLLAALNLSATGISEQQRTPVQSVLGGSYTFPTGWTVTAEWHHDGEGLNGFENRRMYDQIAVDSALASETMNSAAICRLLTTNQMLGRVRQNKDTLFLMAGILWGHEKFSMQSVVLRKLQDGSTALIPSLNAQPHRHWQIYLRPSIFIGKHKSEYGSLMMKMVLVMGLRYNL